MKTLGLLFLSLFSAACFGQFAPAAGEPGSTAIPAASYDFVGWGESAELIRGFQNIADTTLGYATVGDETSCIGMPGENGVVSLGDAGEIIVEVFPPISDFAGFDFAVFENSFNDSFLELAFVEVSSDGELFFRFPATSLSQDTLQYDNNAEMDPTKINNLAGKYRANYGTPFDLAELDSVPDSLLDRQRVRFVKLVDVVGKITEPHASYDQYGNVINDPWPTPFGQGGFDLDAVGVLNSIQASTHEKQKIEIKVWPNPAKTTLQINLSTKEIQSIDLVGLDGSTLPLNPQNEIDLSNISNGIYFLKVETDMGIHQQKIVVLHE